MVQNVCCAKFGFDDVIATGNWQRWLLTFEESTARARKIEDFLESGDFITYEQTEIYSSLQRSIGSN